MDRPGKVIAVGRNYAAHARELGNAPPEAPFFFLKAPSTMVGDGDPIVLPFDIEGEVHHEAELAVIIGRKGRRIPAAEALDFVLGYACANDVTARTEQKALQERKLPWFGGKNADSFLVLGPLVPAAAVPDPGALRIRCLVDGAVRQDGTTADMTHGVAALVSHASRRLTLHPGDVLLTGTPAGVGPLRPGETVEVAIEGVGRIRNPAPRPDAAVRSTALAAAAVCRGRAKAHAAHRASAARAGERCPMPSCASDPLRHRRHCASRHWTGCSPAATGADRTG